MKMTREKAIEIYNAGPEAFYEAMREMEEKQRLLKLIKTQEEELEKFDESDSSEVES